MTFSLPLRAIASGGSTCITSTSHCQPQCEAPSRFLRARLHLNFPHPCFLPAPTSPVSATCITPSHAPLRRVELPRGATWMQLPLPPGTQIEPWPARSTTAAARAPIHSSPAASSPSSPSSPAVASTPRADPSQAGVPVHSR
ncbi:hypothetical protein ACQJBY_068166 [Aegilops geniculata]